MSTHGSCNGCGKGFGLFKKEVGVGGQTHSLVVVSKSDNNECKQ